MFPVSQISRRRRYMERLPVEVIGYILSRLKNARDVVVASTTCRKWLNARRNYLHSLSFNYFDMGALSSSAREIIITRTIFQTNGLRCLLICMDNQCEFSAAAVIAWLMHTRETLRELEYNAKTSPNINFLDECARGRLEVLTFQNDVITDVNPVYQKFPFLKSLSLACISISALDLNHLLSACPKLENLEFEYLDVVISETHNTVVINNPHLKYIFVLCSDFEKFILIADTLESLYLLECRLEVFELVSKGTLKHLKNHSVSDISIDISGGTEKLEVVDFRDCIIMWPHFLRMISKSSKMRRLRLWDVRCVQGALDLETIFSCCPLLSHMSLYCVYSIGKAPPPLNGLFRFANMVKLELGLNGPVGDFSHWVEGLVERCPKLKKMVLIIGEENQKTERDLFSNTLMRKYMHLEIEIREDEISRIEEER